MKLVSVVKFLFRLRELNIQVLLENDTLRYKAPQGVMTSELLAEIKERKTEIIDFLKQVNPYSAIEPAPEQENYPATAAQKRL
jgi:hypothetical protein